jgi:hypothetical protein
MSTADRHLQEANAAREQYQRDINTHHRVTAIRAVIVAVLALMTYAHFARVLRLNRDLDVFGPRNSRELVSTVASFLTSNLDERDYTLTPAPDARTLLRILDGTDRVLSRNTPPDARFVRQIHAVLEEAKDRPDNIRINLPYFGDVALPLGYITVALLAALSSIGFNLYLLLRQEEIRSVYRYIEAHLDAVTDITEDSEPGPVFHPAYVDERPPLPRRLFDTATGVPWRDVERRRFSLMEFVAAGMTAISVVALLGMACYLILERFSWPLGQTPLLFISLALALLVAFVCVAALHRTGRHVSASTNAQ